MYVVYNNIISSSPVIYFFQFISLCLFLLIFFHDKTLWPKAASGKKRGYMVDPSGHSTALKDITARTLRTEVEM